MINILRNIKKYSIVSIISSFVLGVLLILFPSACIQYTALFIGISIIALGGYAIISYFVKQKSILLVYLGAVTIVFGIVICVKYKEIISLIILLCGIAVLASGVTNLIASIRAIFAFRLVGGISVALSIASIVFGAIAVMNATNLSNSIVQLIGVALLIFGATELVTYIEVGKLAKQAKQDIDEAKQEAELEAKLSAPKSNDIEVEATIEEE